MNLKTILFGEKVTISFTTILSSEECANRLKDSIAKKRGGLLWEWSGDIYGEISGSKFQLVKLYQMSYKDWLARQGGTNWAANQVFHGTLIESQRGTRIDGYFSPSVFVNGWFLFMLIALLAFWIVPYLFVLLDIIPPPEISFVFWESVGVTTMILIILAIMRSGTINGRKAITPIVVFVERVLDAKPDPDDLKRIPVS
jgi:hypothetical protein